MHQPRSFLRRCAKVGYWGKRLRKTIRKVQKAARVLPWMPEVLGGKEGEERGKRRKRDRKNLWWHSLRISLPCLDLGTEIVLGT